MADIAPELLQNIKELYRQGKEGSGVLSSIHNKIKKGGAEYEDADRYAEEIARILNQATRKALTKEALPGGALYYNIAKRVLEPMISEAYNDAAKAAAQIQEHLNKKAGFRIKATHTQLEQKRIDALIEGILKNEEEE